MVMTYNQIDLLKILLRKLNTEENDIIFHIDKKVISRKQFEV